MLTKSCTTSFKITQKSVHANSRSTKAHHSLRTKCKCGTIFEALMLHGFSQIVRIISNSSYVEKSYGQFFIPHRKKFTNICWSNGQQLISLLERVLNSILRGLFEHLFSWMAVVFCDPLAKACSFIQSFAQLLSGRQFVLGKFSGDLRSSIIFVFSL